MCSTVLALLAAILYRYKNDSLSQLNLLIFELSELQRRLKGGETDSSRLVLRSSPQKVSLIADLLALVEEAFCHGLPLSPKVAVILQHLKLMKKLLLDRRRLWLLLLQRLALVVFLVALLRMALMPTFLSFFSFGYDGIACLVGAVMIFITLVIFEEVLPSPWLLTNKALAASWLSSVLGLARSVPDGSSPWFSRLEHLKEQEIFSGVSQETEIIAMLDEWAEAERQSGKERLVRCQDYMAIFELAGGSSAALLMLIYPFLLLFDL